MGGGHGQEEQCWGEGIGDQKPTRSSNSSSGKKERRPKSQAKQKRGERGDAERGGGGHGADYPSLLDSSLWKGGEEVDEGSAGCVAGGSPESGEGLYNFGS